MLNQNINTDPMPLAKQTKPKNIVEFVLICIHIWMCVYVLFEQVIMKKNDEINMSAQSRQALLKQLSLPANLFGNLAIRRPCECNKGICGCCTGMLFSALRQLGCMNITYHPDDFSFEFKMIMNNAVLYKNRVTGRNPPPVCVRMPRFNFIKVCASFYDLHFVGRNMHVCLEMSAFFQDSEIFSR